MLIATSIFRRISQCFPYFDAGTYAQTLSHTCVTEIRYASLYMEEANVLHTFVGVTFCDGSGILFTFNTSDAADTTAEIDIYRRGGRRTKSLRGLPVDPFGGVLESDRVQRSSIAHRIYSAIKGVEFDDPEKAVSLIERGARLYDPDHRSAIVDADGQIIVIVGRTFSDGSALSVIVPRPSNLLRVEFYGVDGHQFGGLMFGYNVD